MNILSIFLNYIYFGKTLILYTSYYIMHAKTLEYMNNVYSVIIPYIYVFMSLYS